ncbi:hypothetical protein HPP92_010045 [Vanilla planifolia]|uniref:Uncharacterized protein n=1 Tax=Vanilla planifolia TaxID=51239 RepID=A0A835V3P5_VANPL|nr:hypothetical protein HPP92_010045 [Vanilla planifolia]
MSSAAASKRALLAEDVHGERLLVVIGPCQGSTRTRFSFSPMPYQQLCPRSHEASESYWRGLCDAGETGSGGTGMYYSRSDNSFEDPWSKVGIGFHLLDHSLYFLIRRAKVPAGI